jgi:hypothetical protein
MRTSPNRILTIIGAVIALAAIIALVMSVTRSDRAWDRSTPEGAVQAYLQAVQSGDNAQAATWFASDSECTVRDLDMAFAPRDVRVDLVSSEITGQTARVVIEIAWGTPGPFDRRMGEEQTYRLVRSGDRWLLSGIPWPVYACGEFKR